MGNRKNNEKNILNAAKELEAKCIHNNTGVMILVEKENCGLAFLKNEMRLTALAAFILSELENDSKLYDMVLENLSDNLVSNYFSDNKVPDECHLTIYIE